MTQSAANVHDSKMLEATLDAIEPIKRPRGRSRKRPHKVHADKGYDYPRCRQALRQRGITPRIARRGIDSSQRLGRHRWVVERTLGWLNKRRSIRTRWCKKPDNWLAFLQFACASILLDLAIFG